MAPPPADDFPADATTTGVIIPNGPPAAGNLNEGGDHDWFAMSVQAGVRYHVHGPGEVRLVDATGKTLEYGVYDNTDEVLYRHPTDGIVYIDFSGHAYGPGEPLDMDYELFATIIPDDHFDGTDATSTLPIGSFITGLSEFRTDQDWLKVELEAGKTYRIDAFGTGALTGKAVDAFIEVHDEDGKLLAENDDSNVGVDATLFFTAPETGTYFVATGEADMTEGGNAGWQMGIREVGMNEPAHVSGWTGSDEAFHFTGTPESEPIYGTRFGDFITGNGGFDTVRAFDGDDWINASGDIDGGAGNDKILGGASGDFITGGLGNDDISGNGGADSFFYADGDGKDFIRGFDADDVLILDTAHFATEQDVIDAAEVMSDRIVLRLGEGDKIVLFQPEIGALTEDNIELGLGVI